MDNPRNTSNDSQNSYVKRQTGVNADTNMYRRTAPTRQYSDSDVNYRKTTTRQGTPAEQKRPAQTKAPRSGMTPEMIKAERKKAAKKKMIIRNVRQILIILAVVIIISVLIAVFVISGVKDVLAINVSEDDSQSVTVEITEGMDTSDVISTLKSAGVIKNTVVCKLAAMYFGYTNEGYIARTYEFNRSMGLENILNEIKDLNSDAAKTVTLTFPEGYTADQIIDLLAENEVCTREKLIETINTVDFSEDYDFLKAIINSDQRYNRLEGYLFPDTYEFYIGEDPSSVIKKFLNNFNKKWTENYTEKAEEIGMSIDEVVRLASIIEKEAVGSDMPVVASILMNRLDAGMRLECDSTGNYISSNTSGLSDTQVEAYNSLYNTYICGSLPVGAISNPGADALEAVLYAPETSYYYFIHDSDNVLRTAKTLSEHEKNVSYYGLAQ